MRLAGAELLGLDVASICDTQVLNQVRSVLDPESNRERLAIDMVRTSTYAEATPFVERTLLQRKTLNGGSFKTKDRLREAIEAFFRRHNAHVKPFRWRKREVRGSQLQNTIVDLRNQARSSFC
jgi:hypothetical protein